MRAGEHDGIGAPSAGIDEAGRDLPCDEIIGDRRATQLVLCEAREPRRADERDIAAVGEVADQRKRVFAADGGLRAKHCHALGARDGAGWLDRRQKCQDRTLAMQHSATVILLQLPFSPRIKCGGLLDRCVRIGAQAVPFREPIRIVEGEPCIARCLLPN